MFLESFEPPKYLQRVRYHVCFYHKKKSTKTCLLYCRIIFCRKSKPISQKMILLEEVDFLQFLKFLHKQRLWKNLTKSWKKDHYRLLTRVPRLSAMYLKISSIQPKMNRKVRIISLGPSINDVGPFFRFYDPPPSPFEETSFMNGPFLAR